MSYHINYSLISLDQFKEKLKKTRLVPSRKILLQNTDQIFERLKDFGFNTIEDLLTQIKNKKRLNSLAKVTSIDEHYLTILSREIRSTLPKPEKLTGFNGFDPEVFEILTAIGIKNTKQLWEAGLTKTNRDRICKQCKIDSATIEQLICLSDLCRVRWVNTTFAEMLWMANVHNVQDLCEQYYMELYDSVNELNKKHQWYHAKIGSNDFFLVIEAAKELSIDLDIGSV